MNKSGDEIGGTFGVVDPTTGGLSAADDTPTAVLSVNGVDSAAVVTVTATGATGRYKWSCTLPAGIGDGDALTIWIAAEVGGVSGGNNVWHGVGCTVRPADLPATAAAIAAAVWAYVTRTLTQTAAAVAAALAGDTITIRRGDTLSVSITGLGDISSRTKLWITGKGDRGHPDTSAVFLVEETAGLVYLAGAVAATPTNAELVVTDEVAGDLTLTIKGVETAKLAELVTGSYDIQVLETAGPRTLSDGELNVSLDVTRATS